MSGVLIAVLAACQTSQNPERAVVSSADDLYAKKQLLACFKALKVAEERMKVYPAYSKDYVAWIVDQIADKDGRATVAEYDATAPGKLHSLIDCNHVLRGRVYGLEYLRLAADGRMPETPEQDLALCFANRRIQEQRHEKKFSRSWTDAFVVLTDRQWRRHIVGLNALYGKDRLDWARYEREGGRHLRTISGLPAERQLATEIEWFERCRPYGLRMMAPRLDASGNVSEL